jgi:hypothetical protein
MAQLGNGLNGYLDVQDATLRAPRLEAVSNIGIANTAPQHAFSVGSNLYVSTESSNVLTVDGSVVCEGVKVGLIEIVPSYDLAAVSNVGNVTANTIIFTNETQGFVATGNATIGSTLTISGFRITAAAAAEDDLQAITTSTQDKPNAGDTTNAIRVRNGTESTSFNTGALQVGTDSGANGGLGVAGNVHVNQGVYTQDLSVENVVSNLAVNTDDLFVDIVNSRVGIGKTDPTATLDVVGNVALDTNTLFVDSVNNKVGIGKTDPQQKLHVDGAITATHMSLGTSNYPTLGGNWLTIFSPTYDGSIGDNHPDPDGGILFANQSGLKTFPWGYYMGVVKDVASTSPTSLRFDIGKSNDLNSDGSGGGAADTLTPYLTIDNGNVGIGSDAPTQRLDVNGSIRSTGMIVGDGQMWSINLNMYSAQSGQRKVAIIPGGAYTIWIRALRVGDNTYSGKFMDVILNKGQFGISDISSYNINSYARNDSSYGPWPEIQHSFETNGFQTTGFLKLLLYNANQNAAGVAFHVTVTLVGSTQGALVKDFSDDF